jgi:hypothetical protein
VVAEDSNKCGSAPLVAGVHRHFQGDQEVVVVHQGVQVEEAVHKGAQVVAVVHQEGEQKGAGMGDQLGGLDFGKVVQSRLDSCEVVQ